MLIIEIAAGVALGIVALNVINAALAAGPREADWSFPSNWERTAWWMAHPNATLCEHEAWIYSPRKARESDS